MTYRIIIRPEAEADMANTYHWYENQRKGLGAQLLLGIEASINSLEQNPEIYQKIHKNIHRALIRRFPYGIFYIVEGQIVHVIAFLHASRDPKKWQERDSK